MMFLVSYSVTETFFLKQVLCRSVGEVERGKVEGHSCALGPKRIKYVVSAMVIFDFIPAGGVLV